MMGQSARDICEEFRKRYQRAPKERDARAYNELLAKITDEIARWSVRESKSSDELRNTLESAQWLLNDLASAVEQSGDRSVILLAPRSDALLGGSKRDVGAKKRKKRAPQLSDLSAQEISKISIMYLHLQCRIPPLEGILTRLLMSPAICGESSGVYWSGEADTLKYWYTGFAVVSAVWIAEWLSSTDATPTWYRLIIAIIVAVGILEWLAHRRNNRRLLTAARVYDQAFTPASIRQIRDAARKAEGMGVRWPPALYAFLDELLARGRVSF
jgi:hypothetical protein